MRYFLLLPFAALLIFAPLRAAHAQSQSFEAAFEEAVERFCAAVVVLERDLVVTRPSKGRMRGNIAEATRSARAAAGFMDTVSLEGLAEDHAARLIAALEMADECHLMAVRIGRDWWPYFDNQWGDEPADRQREREWIEAILVLGAKIREHLPAAPGTGSGNE